MASVVGPLVHAARSAGRSHGACRSRRSATWWWYSSPGPTEPAPARRASSAILIASRCLSRALPPGASPIALPMGDDALQVERFGRPPLWVQAARLAVACLAFAVGLFLAWHHPLWPAGGKRRVSCSGQSSRLGRAAYGSSSCRPPCRCLNFSPWTGWLVFDEFDLLVLGGSRRRVRATRLRARRTRFPWRQTARAIRTGKGRRGPGNRVRRPRRCRVPARPRRRGRLVVRLV